MKTKLITITLLFLVFIACQKKTSDTSDSQSSESIYEKLEAGRFSEVLQANPKAPILDVRSPEEYQTGHLENAQNLNWNEKAAFEKGIASLDKKSPIFVYCLAGSRSSAAAQKLQSMGFTTIYELEGGYLKWRAAGLADQPKAVGMTQADLNKILNTDKKVLIDFYTTWCGPCKKLKPTLEKIAEEMKADLVVVSIDAEANMALAETLKVDGYPTLILYQNKKQIWRNLGYLTEEEIKKQL